MTDKPWPEMHRPTPAQYLPWFLQQPTAEQVGILAGLFAEVEAADWCRWSDHEALLDQREAEHRKASGQWACTCGAWHYDDQPCPKGGTQIMATGSEGWDL